MLPLIQNEVVLKNSWLSMAQFADIIAVAEITPGPVAINTATFVCYKTASFAGAFFATLGVVLPSFMLIVLLAGLVIKYKDNKYLKSAFSGLRPIVVALIVGAAFLIGRETVTGHRDLIYALAALLLMVKSPLNPILIILFFGLGAVIF